MEAWAATTAAIAAFDGGSGLPSAAPDDAEEEEDEEEEEEAAGAAEGSGSSGPMIASQLATMVATRPALLLLGSVKPERSSEAERRSVGPKTIPRLLGFILLMSESAATCAKKRIK